MMIRHLLITLLASGIGAAAAAAQAVTQPHQLPQFAPGPAASPYVPSAPAIAPGPAAPEFYGSRKIAPGPAGPADSVARAHRHQRETYSDRIVRCTHYGTSIGIGPNDIGSYAAQCAHRD
jgi:hypothetical protein